MKYNCLEFTTTPEGRGFLERPPAPPEAAAAYVCPECGATLYAGQSLRRERLWDDIVGCETCSSWVAVERLEVWCDSCPNCGEAPGDGDGLLVSEGGLVIACDCCAADIRVELAGIMQEEAA